MRLWVQTFSLVSLAWSTPIAAQTPKADSASVETQATPTSALHSTIATLDSALFAAFNQRDLRKLRTFFAPDLEFYQDNEGVENYVQTMRDFGQMFGQSAPIRRELLPGSLAVYPIKKYGAIEVGKHRFCHVENGKDDCGTFQFIHIWRRTTSGWKISRVVSYGH